MGYYLPQTVLHIRNLWCAYDGSDGFYLSDACLICAECGSELAENPGYGFFTASPPEKGNTDTPFKFDVNSGMDWDEFCNKKCKPVPLGRKQPKPSPSYLFERPSLNLASRYVWAYMMRNRLNTTSFAKEVGVSRETLSRILNRKQPPSMSLALKLAEVTGFTFNDLFPDFLEEKQGESTTS